MKAIISSTYDDKYLFFLPIVTWCWNKLGIGTICFTPKVKIPTDTSNEKLFAKICLVESSVKGSGIIWEGFSSPKDKEATYAQCSRLYAGALDLPDDEILITSDIDMAVFLVPPFHANKFNIWGSDLTPDGQYPICYITNSATNWMEYFGVAEKYTGMKSKDKWINKKSLQECLDSLLGDIECDNFRGNYWGKDQEEAFLRINKFNPQRIIKIPRARPGTQFASNRVDRDDANWRSCLGPDLVDAHLWRPGYTQENFANILELLTTQYPNDNFDWLVAYRNEYIKLL